MNIIIILFERKMKFLPFEACRSSCASKG